MLPDPDKRDAGPAGTGPAPKKKQVATSNSTTMVTTTTDVMAKPMTTGSYGTSPLRRNRRTAAQYDELDLTIVSVCELDHPLSVRGVFYRVMSAGAVAKTEQEYGVVQRRVLKLRRSGELPYEWIADGTRWQVKAPSWSNVDQALEDAAISYRRALWHDQAEYVEIWSEKEAISSIVSPVTDSYDVPLMIARGFASETFLHSTATTIAAVGKPTTIYQLGDHDPSGVAAWTHVQTKLREFAPEADIVFERLAVTEDQIAALSLPTRPTKKSDSRAKNFVGESVEVDAIPTRMLRSLLTAAIENHIDPIALHATRLAEEHERAGLQALADGWSA